MKKLLLMLIMISGMFVLQGCIQESSADTTSHNLSEEAEEFKLFRRITAINGITDSLLQEIIGYCSIETGQSMATGMMEVTCKNGPNQFSKDFVYLSDNVMITVEQLEDIDVPQYHRIIRYTPQKILPVFDIVGGGLGE